MKHSAQTHCSTKSAAPCITGLQWGFHASFHATSVPDWVMFSWIPGLETSMSALPFCNHLLYSSVTDSAWAHVKRLVDLGVLLMESRRWKVFPKSLTSVSILWYSTLQCSPLIVQWTWVVLPQSCHLHCLIIFSTTTTFLTAHCKQTVKTTI